MNVFTLWLLSWVNWLHTNYLAFAQKLTFYFAFSPFIWIFDMFVNQCNTVQPTPLAVWCIFLARKCLHAGLFYANATYQPLLALALYCTFPIIINRAGHSGHMPWVPKPHWPFFLFFFYSFGVAILLLPTLPHQPLLLFDLRYMALKRNRGPLHLWSYYLFKWRFSTCNTLLLYLSVGNHE